MTEPFRAPLASKRIREDVLAQIRHLIESGHLKRGDRLPTERELAESFMVSRASVREALRILEALGVIRCRPGEGTFVREHPADWLAGPLARLLVTPADAAAELLELRRLLEPELARLAAERAAPDDVRRLAAALDGQAGGADGIESDRLFHRAVAAAAGNRVALRLVETAVGLLAELGAPAWTLPGSRDVVLAAHRRLVEAVRAGDGWAARQAMLDELDRIGSPGCGPAPDRDWRRAP
ncbi:MAG TPA: FCD domain-containing protein [Thermodesulfobacteriota bacterium]|nr:FCD domain-containing protein [Thermodesulfobacteriota bacterium]